MSKESCSLPKFFLMPVYAANFKCAGEKCSRICCSRTNDINVSKELYYRFHYLPDTDPARLDGQRFIKRVPPKQKTPHSPYASIHCKDGHCPFFSDKKLCTLYEGHDGYLLPENCMKFPRTIYLADNRLYMGCMLSCIQSAKLALLNKDGIEFALCETNDVPLSPEVLFSHQSTVYTNGYARYFKEIQFFVISLLQNRNYAIWQRLVILGMFMKQLGGILFEDTLTFISAYNDYINNGNAHELLSDIIKNPKCGIYASLCILSRPNVLAPDDADELSKLIDLTCGALNLHDTSTDSERTKYVAAFSSRYAFWLEDNSCILENMLVSEVFNAPSALLVFDRHGAFDAFKRLAVYYLIVRHILLGLAAADTLTQDSAVDAICLLTKCYAPSHLDLHKTDAFINFPTSTNSMGFFASLLTE